MSSKGSATRERLLEVTWELLERDGSDLTLADVAAAADVSRQAVYLHFGSRAGLLIAAVRHNDVRTGIGERFSQAVGSASSGVEAVEAWLRVWVGYVPTILTVAGLLSTSAAIDPAARDALADRMRHQRDKLTQIFEWIQTDGMLRDDLEPGEAADMLWSLAHVTAWTQLVDDCGWSEERFLESRLELLECMMLRR